MSDEALARAPIAAVDLMYPEQIVEQTIDRETSAFFRKSVYRVALEVGATALVRKRLVQGAELPPVLLTHGFAQNHYAWHVPSRSFSAYLAAAGFDVYSIDLRGVGRARLFGAPRPTRLQDYIEIDVPRALAVIARLSGSEPLFLIGHSMGGAISCSVAGLLPQRVRGVVSLAGLYAFGCKNNAVKAVCTLALALQTVAPMRLWARVPTKTVGDVLRLTRVGFNSRLGGILPLQAWAPGSMEDHVLNEYLERSFAPSTIGIVSELSRLSRGDVLTDARGVSYFERFESARLPTLVVTGSDDLLISVPDAVACYERSRSPHKACHVFTPDGRLGPRMGHVDLFMGREAPYTTWPLVRDWLVEQSGVARVRAVG